MKLSTTDTITSRQTNPYDEAILYKNHKHHIPLSQTTRSHLLAGITKHQRNLLLQIYKFKAVTASLLAEYRAVHYNGIRRSLNLLVKKGYLEKRYKNNYRLLGKSARYYLTPHVATILRQDERILPAGLRCVYTMPRASEAVLEQTISCLKQAVKIRNHSKANGLVTDIYSKQEYITRQFVRPHSDMYIRIYSQDQDDVPLDAGMLLDIRQNQHVFLVKQRIRAYYVAYQKDNWQEVSNNFPSVYILVSASTKNRLQPYLQQLVHDNDNIGPHVQLIVTIEELFSLKN